MGKRQHRCPYYLLQITSEDLKKIKSIKEEKSNLIFLYEKQLNELTIKYNELRAVFDKIINIVQPFLNDKKILTLEEVVNNSLLNEKTKKSTLSFIHKYTDYCKNKLEADIYKSNGNINLSNIPIIYDPKNAFDFVTNENSNYKRSSVKKNLNTLLRYIRLATKNPYLDYEMPIGRGEPSKLKHIITKEELKKFIKYLNSQKYYILIVICILMFKFGVRIGAIAKIKVSDLLSDNTIIFREKNNAIIKRKLIDETSRILRRLIDELELKEDSYMFYYFKFPFNENKRIQFLVQKMRNTLHDSQCFSLSSMESLSSHIFRATYAVNYYEKLKLDKIKNELGHKYLHTTINSYINPEKRGLNLISEENNMSNIGINALKNRIKKSNYSKCDSTINIDIEDDSLSSDEEGEDFIDDDFILNEEIFFFTGHFYDDKDICEFRKKEKKYNNIFMNEKGISLDDEMFHSEEERNNCFNLEKEKTNYANIEFNSCSKKNMSNIDNKNIAKFIGVKDFENLIDIKETEINMLIKKRIKNKKELFVLSEEGYDILKKTIDLNKKGLYFNMKIEEDNNCFVVKATSNIKKNTLITVAGGEVYYRKDLSKINSSCRGGKKLANYILYFKTSKSSYDRILKINEKSIINYFFNGNSSIEYNLDIIKIVDEKDKILLIIKAIKEIKTGQIISLNTDLLNI